MTWAPTRGNHVNSSQVAAHNEPNGEMMMAEQRDIFR